LHGAGQVADDGAVPDKQGPTLRAQWLGQQLKDLREQAGYTLRQAAEFLERDPSTVSRFESAEYPVRRADLMALLDFYTVLDKHRREALLTLREDVWRKGWWDRYAEEVDRRFIDYVWLESRAREIHTFDNTLLLGLLQTRDYARAVIAAADFDANPEQVDRWVELRMTRQGILASDDPPRLVSIIDEAVLRRVVGGPEVARAQLRHLAECTRRSNVDIRVLPFSAGAHASPAGAFRILSLQDPYPDVAYAETLAGAVYVEAPDVKPFVQAYDRLYQVSLDPKKSAELISASAKELQ
jgi:transcriptional regulator with XRE-family HTH domain